MATLITDAAYWRRLEFNCEEDVLIDKISTFLLDEIALECDNESDAVFISHLYEDDKYLGSFITELNYCEFTPFYLNM